MIFALEPPVLTGLGVLGSFASAVAGAFVSVRLVRPRQQQLIASAGLDDSKRWDALMQRYENVVRDQDDQLRSCHTRIDELEDAEKACEKRNQEHAHRIDHLEDVLRRAGLNYQTEE